jgi:hypothetical protein
MAGNSIFSSKSAGDPFYVRQPVASTINNIIINNFNAGASEPNGVIQQTHVAHSNMCQSSNAPLSFFPPLNAVIKQNPTIEQAAELAQVTQMAGGVKPLHHSNKPKPNRPA